jgi:hypothetical protein
MPTFNSEKAVPTEVNCVSKEVSSTTTTTTTTTTS